MSDKTNIEWTDHTFNPWWGCVRVSPACEHCYAETFAARFGVKWGVKAERKIASEKVWNDPLRWDRAAEKAGVRRKVFCASMADIVEDRRDLDEPRARVFALIERTPHLDWQLLTKRPEAVMKLVPEAWREGFPRNVWMGTTVEDQRRAGERIPHLLALPARVKFLSCEPLLGPVDITPWTQAVPSFEEAVEAAIGEISLAEAHAAVEKFKRDRLGVAPWESIDWVIAGGESGPGARPMHPNWVRSLRDQCALANVPFFFKQWGDWAPYTVEPGKDLGEALRSGRVVHVRAIGESDGHFRQGDVYMERVGKRIAGSTLDGREHKEWPR